MLHLMGANPNLMLMEFAQVTENGVGMHKIGGSVRASKNLVFWGAKLKVTSRNKKQGAITQWELHSWKQLVSQTLSVTADHSCTG